MYTALERIQMKQEAGSCTDGATMLSSSNIHSNSFSCHPSVASTSSEAASNNSVVSGKTIGAESESSTVSSQSDREAALSSQVHNNEKNEDASKVIHATNQDLEEVMPQWIRFLLCWGESLTPNSDSGDIMTNKDILLQDLLQVEYNYNLQRSKHQGMLQSYSSHSLNAKANATSNSFSEASVCIPDDRLDISNKRSTRSFVEGSSSTRSSRQNSSNGKAAYENFLGRKTNTTIISSDTTSSKTDNSSCSSHYPKASYGLSSLSTQSSELGSRLDISNKRLTRSFVEGSSSTKSSRQNSSNGSSEYPKAAYENFLGRKTNTTIISSDTTSSKADNSSSSHDPKASYGLSSISTQSSELDSSMITTAPLQYSSASSSSSEVMSHRGLKANTTNISSSRSASTTGNSNNYSYGSLISSSSRSIADTSSATSSQKNSSLSSSSFGKFPESPSDTTETSNLSTYRGATLRSSTTTSSGITAQSLFSKISKTSKKCSRKIVRYFDSKGKPPLPSRSHSENHATEVSLEQVAKNESMVMENNNASLQLMPKQQYEGLERSNALLHVTTSSEPTSNLIPMKTADNASLLSSHFTLPEAIKPGNSVISTNTVDASKLSSQLTSPGVSKATFTSIVASKSDVSKDSMVERGIVSLSRKTALKAGNSFETRQIVDESTLSSHVITLGVSETTTTSIAASKTGVLKDSVVERETVVPRKLSDHSLISLVQVPEPSLALTSVSTHVGEGDENVVSVKNTFSMQRLKSMDILSDEDTLSSSKLIEAQKHPSPVASKEEIISKQPADSGDIAISP